MQCSSILFGSLTVILILGSFMPFFPTESMTTFSSRMMDVMVSIS